MKNLPGKNVLVLGLGASGLALARWCVRNKAQVTVADTRESPPQLQALRDSLPMVKFVHSQMDEALFSSVAFDLVLKSPGLSPASVAPVVNAAEARGTARGNEVSLFAQALADLKEDRGYAPKVIAITGTNGKTTVTSLVGQLVQRAGKSVAVAGNIGPSLLDTLTEKLDLEPEMQPVALEVIEISPMQAATASAPIFAADEPRSAQHETLDAVPDELSDEEIISDREIDPVEASDELPNIADDLALPEILTPPASLAVPVFTSLPEVWVLELSSFQLDAVNNFEPTVATVLNVTQDHLDWHETMPAYAAAKARIYGHGLKLLNRDDPQVMAALPAPLPLVKGKQPPAQPYLTFGSDSPLRPGDYGMETVNGMAWLVRATVADETIKRRKDEEVVLYIQRLMPVDALRIRGRHNACNALAALGLAVAAGCNLAPMLHGLREYRGEPHRVESIAVIHDVEYFDDSKGTNVGATVAALQGLGADRKLVLIVGGEGKGQDFSPLAAPVSRYARAVVLMGRDAALIKAALATCDVPLFEVLSMADAVRVAAEHARTGDAVLMSPACASFDMFENYEHRARVFCDSVKSTSLEAGLVA